MSTMTKDQARENKGSGNRPIREGVDEFKRDAQNIKEDLEVLKDDATELGSHATQHTIDAAKAGVQSTTEMAKGACDSMKQYQDGMNNQIRARPTTSVLLALGAGVMLGRVLGSMRR